MLRKLVHMQRMAGQQAQAAAGGNGGGPGQVRSQRVGQAPGGLVAGRRQRRSLATPVLPVPLEGARASGRTAAAQQARPCSFKNGL